MRRGRPQRSSVPPPETVHGPGDEAGQSDTHEGHHRSNDCGEDAEAHPDRTDTVVEGRARVGDPNGAVHDAARRHRHCDIEEVGIECRGVAAAFGSSSLDGAHDLGAVPEARAGGRFGVGIGDAVTAVVDNDDPPARIPGVRGEGRSDVGRSAAFERVLGEPGDHRRVLFDVAEEAVAFARSECATQRDDQQQQRDDRDRQVTREEAASHAVGSRRYPTPRIVEIQSG